MSREGSGDTTTASRATETPLEMVRQICPCQTFGNIPRGPERAARAYWVAESGHRRQILGALPASCR